MPPKRKAPGKAAAGGKKAKKEEEADDPKTVHDHIASLKAADAGKKKKHKPDDRFPYAASCEVYDDYDCMLNQTNIGHNNNKYYVIQVLKMGPTYYTWNRWGRVGESGTNAQKAFSNVNDATKDFEKKFRDKTKNKWADRASFKPVPGKYTMIEMAGEEEDEVDAPTVKTPTGPTAACTLDAPTQSLMKLIFDHDMFQDAMKSFDIDVKKMPLGKLSKSQIAKGFECLDDIEKALNAKKPKSTLTALSSTFYTLIPHDFGRRIPPTIDTLETLRSKMDMLLVLGDIALAQEMEKERDKMAGSKKDKDKPAHPLDVNYNLLKCDLERVDPKSKEYKILETYTDNTKCAGWRPVKIKHVWKMNRHSERDRVKAHDKITNRKLLWHGTNVAVVAAILKSGLRIMPHSGGRVGRGIYFASENGKSAGYTRPAGKRGIMFLNEAILGKEKHISMDDSSLTKAPSGFDCVVAKGWTEPDPSKDTFLTLDGKKVIVPQGKPISQSAFANKSSFSQSEYLVYQENQVRMRYIFEMEM